MGSGRHNPGAAGETLRIASQRRHAGHRNSSVRAFAADTLQI